MTWLGLESCPESGSESDPETTGSGSGDSDVGDKVMMVTCRCRQFLNVGDRISILMSFFNVGARGQCQKIVDVGDQNGKIRHQHLKVVINTFLLQHPSPTSM